MLVFFFFLSYIFCSIINIWIWFDMVQESRLLCRVIFSGQPSSKIETQPEKGKTIIKSENRSLATSIDLTLSISYDRRGSKVCFIASLCYSLVFMSF